MEYERYMQRAVELAGNVPELPFAALIADGTTGEILAEGWNRSSKNPTWHGEIDAINSLASDGCPTHAGNLVLFTTAEPCPMCQAAVLWTGIGTVVSGTSIMTLMKTGWKQIGISAEEVVRRSPQWKCQLVAGVLEAECDALFEKAMRRKRQSSQ